MESSGRIGKYELEALVLASTTLESVLGVEIQRRSGTRWHGNEVGILR